MSVPTQTRINPRGVARFLLLLFVVCALFVGLVLVAPWRSTSSATSSNLFLTTCPSSACTTVGFWAGETRVDGAGIEEPVDQADYWAPRDLAPFTPALWNALATYHTPLYLALYYERDFGPVPAGEPRAQDGLSLIRTAHKYGVPIVAWLLLPPSEGYYVGEANAATAFASLRAFAAWDHQQDLGIKEAVFDSETPITSSEVTEGITAPAPLVHLEQNLDPQLHCSSTELYAQAISWGHAHGLKVGVTGLPWVLDDLANGTSVLQNMLKVDTAPPNTWDDYFFQAYRSFYATFPGGDPGPSLAASYFRSGQRDFGERSQISLGVIGTGPYRDLANAETDVRTLVALGAREIPLYSLETTLATFGLPGVIALARASEAPFIGPQVIDPVTPSRATATVRSFFRAVAHYGTLATARVTKELFGAAQSPTSAATGCPSNAIDTSLALNPVEP
jgi:hypothetical protein